MDIDLLILQNHIIDSINFQKDLLAELEAKKSTRTELIDALKKNIANLSLSYVRFKQMDSDLRQANRRNFDLETICMKQQAEIIELTRKTNNIIDAFDSGKIELTKKD